MGIAFPARLWIGDVLFGKTETLLAKRYVMPVILTGGRLAEFVFVLDSREPDGTLNYQLEECAMRKKHTVTVED